MVWSTLMLLVCALPQRAAEPAGLLARIRRNMAGNLAHLPDYTCRQTIERSRRPAGTKKFAFADRVRIDVSYVSGKELFAWPGAEKFEDKALHQMVPGGAAGTGSFGLHARDVFTSNAPTFEYKGEVQEKGRRLVGWTFQIAREKSNYVVSSSPEAAAIVGYHGSFWADADTLDLVRLEVETDEVPENVAVARGSERVEYQRLRIGTSAFLLPRTSDLFMADRTGNESHNHADFEACRQYAGESVVRFGDPEAEPVSALPKPLAALPPLPAGLEVELILKSGIHALKSAIGDPVRATLVRAVKKGEAVALPKEAVLTGRISRIEHRTGRPGTLYVVGVQLDRVESGNARGPFHATLETVAFPSSRRYVALPSGKDDLPGEGLFAIYGGQSPEVSNLRMVWRTVAP